MSRSTETQTQTKVKVKGRFTLRQGSKPGIPNKKQRYKKEIEQNKPETFQSQKQVAMGNRTVELRQTQKMISEGGLR